MLFIKGHGYKFILILVNSLTAVVADRRQIITLPPKKQLGAGKQTSCDKLLAADKQGADKQLGVEKQQL